MEDNALYRPIFQKAWQITTRFKHLWFLGLFAAIIGSGEIEIILRALSDPNAENSVWRGLINAVQTGWQNGLIQGGGHFWANLWSAFSSRPSALITLFLLLGVILVMVLFFVWLGLVCQGGLIKSLDLANKNKKATLNQSIDFGVKKFWPLLAANVILKIFLGILFLILGWAILALAPYGLVGRAVYYASFVAVVILILVASFLTRYQIFFLLLKDKKFRPALKSGWQLFQANWLVSLETAVMMFGIYFAGAAAITIISLILLAVPLALAFYFSVTGWLFGLITILALVVMVLAAFFITAWINTFQWSVWTLVFNRLAGEGGVSKIIRGARQLPNYFTAKQITAKQK